MNDWRDEPVSDKQKHKLRYFGYVFQSALTKGEASDIIEDYMQKFPDIERAWQTQPAFPGQLEELRNYGHEPAPRITVQQAHLWNEYYRSGQTTPQPQDPGPAFLRSRDPEALFRKDPFPWLRAGIWTASAAAVAVVAFALAGWTFGLIFIAALVLIYFLPTFVGYGKRNAGAIFLLNLLLGWTFIGWAAALIWAATKDTEAK